MPLLLNLSLAFGLAMDAFTVSIGCGCTLKDHSKKRGFEIAFLFGFFQTIMPIIGWAVGRFFSSYISRFDHWIAFGLLVLIGGKMVHEAFEKKEEENVEPTKREISHKRLILMALATSIDALAVGLSLAFLSYPIFVPSIIIGLFTFLLCLIGFFSGVKLHKLLGEKADLVGGLILIAIGVKIVLEHFQKGI